MTVYKHFDPLKLGVLNETIDATHDTYEATANGKLA